MSKFFGYVIGFTFTLAAVALIAPVIFEDNNWQVMPVSQFDIDMALLSTLPEYIENNSTDDMEQLSATEVDSGQLNNMIPETVNSTSYPLLEQGLNSDNTAVASFQASLPKPLPTEPLTLTQSDDKTWLQAGAEHADSKNESTVSEASKDGFNTPTHLAVTNEENVSEMPATQSRLERDRVAPTHKFAQVMDKNWFTLWEGFYSRISAKGFISHLETKSDQEFRLTKESDGKFSVQLAYQNQERLQHALADLSEQTGLELGAR